MLPFNMSSKYFFSFSWFYGNYIRFIFVLSKSTMFFLCGVIVFKFCFLGTYPIL